MVAPLAQVHYDDDPINHMLEVGRPARRVGLLDVTGCST
jgi:hypothetical protein